MYFHNYNPYYVMEDLRVSQHKKLILDTDTYNEIDDQFAVAYAMTAEDIDLVALTAAPFLNSHSTSPEDGMEKSYQEMKKVRDLVDPEGKMGVPCYRGSRGYLKNLFTPQPSEAAENMVRIVREANDTVYIAVIGCFTNAASAILMDHSICDKAVIVMIGAQKFDHRSESGLEHSANEFNLMQDRLAARVIFESGIPVVVIPAGGVTDKLYTTAAEVKYFIGEGGGKVGKYLSDIFEADEGAAENAEGLCRSRSRPIYDIGSIAFLRMKEKCCHYEIVPVKTVDGRGAWYDLRDGREMIMVESMNRNAVLSDMFTVIRRYGKKQK